MCGRYNIICWVFILFLPLESIAQDYLKTLDSPDNFFGQKIARATGGEVYIGDSSLEALNTGEDGRLLLTKLDNCGQVEWSYFYETEGIYVEFRDIITNSDDEVILFGSAYLGFDERVFLLKVGSDGAIKRFKLFNTGTVDHFTYNIDIKEGQIMAYGLLLDWNVQKQGFIALFDNELNYQWGKRFAPVITGGEAIFTPEGGFLCRTGHYIYKLDAQGNLAWANFNDSNISAPVAGPIAVSGGYIFETTQENKSFFFKLDDNGQLLWMSPRFPSTNYAADIKRQANGDLLAVYTTPQEEGNDICYLLLAPDGEIIQQRKLIFDRPFTTGQLEYSLGDEGYLTVVGNAAIPPAPAPALKDFLLQASLTNNSNDCFYWEDFENTTAHSFNPSFTPVDTAILDLNMTLWSEQIQVNKIAIEAALYTNECDQSPDGNKIKVDTLLNCGEDWLVSLPSEEFVWLDNGRSDDRLLTDAGEYRASNVDCTNPISYTFTLDRKACECDIFLPTAFSPNNDSQNDELSLFSNCSLSQIEMKVYSRWGNELVNGKAEGFSWDGMSNGKAVPPGLYLVLIRYELIDEVGEIQQGEITQEVMLLR